MMPVRRNSIHRRNNLNDEESVKKCETCSKTFHLKNNTETEINEEKAHELKQILIKNNKLYPTLPNEFVCKNCGSGKTEDSTRTTTSKVEEKVEEIKSTTTKSKWYTKYQWLLVMLVGLVGYWIISKDSKSFPVNLDSVTDEEMKLAKEVRGLSKIYTNQEEKVWYTLTSGIKSVKKTNMPTVFLMLHNSDSALKTTLCLAKQVSKIATKFLMGWAKDPVLVTKYDLNKQRYLNDPGMVMEDYKYSVENRGAMIVPNLQEIPRKVVTQFHYFADKYSPLVDKAVYFFTLHVDEFTAGKIDTALANDRLLQIWEGMPDNLVLPLITRLTTLVIKIHSDNTNC